MSLLLSLISIQKIPFHQYNLVQLANPQQLEGFSKLFQIQCRFEQQYQSVIIHKDFAASLTPFQQVEHRWCGCFGHASLVSLGKVHVRSFLCIAYEPS